MKKIKKTSIILALALSFLVGCSDADRSRHVLRQAGYTEIVTEGYSFFGCSEDDNVRTKFHAIGPSGMGTSGVVCCQWALIDGVAKGCTIRLD